MVANAAKMEKHFRRPQQGRFYDFHCLRFARLDTENSFFFFFLLWKHKPAVFFLPFINGICRVAQLFYSGRSSPSHSCPGREKRKAFIYSRYSYVILSQMESCSAGGNNETGSPKL